MIDIKIQNWKISKKITISILIPVFNEEQSVSSVLKKIKGKFDLLPFDYEIIVIDDGSSDRTLKILDQIEYITLLRNPYNLGYGASLKKGLKAAKGEWCLIMDSDGTYSPEDIPLLLKYVNEYDMVVGNRGNKEDILERKVGKWILKKIAGYLVGRTIPDINSGMRVFKRDLAMEFYNLYPPGFSFTTTITMAFIVNSYTVKYVDIEYGKRTGESSMRPWHFFDFVILIFRIIVFFRPLKMFSIGAVILFALGVTKAIKDILVVKSIGNLAVFLIIFAIQVFLMALLSEIIIRKKGI